jgi:hypothetical protein
MTDVSRRQFLRHASIGAVATGALAAGGGVLFQAVSSGHPDASAAPLKLSTTAAPPDLEGSDVFAHVVDAKAGQITIFVGSKSISYTSHDLAQALMRAAQ